MIVDKLEITNFRCFSAFALPLGGSLFLVSENGVGKSALLAAIAHALGQDRTITKADFGDLNKPLEIVATLSGFEKADQKHFPKELSFAGPKPTLKIGFRAQWNAGEEEIDDAICGFPDHGWKGASKTQRAALQVIWLPADRDTTRLLNLSTRRSFWARLAGALNLDPAFVLAGNELETALKKLAATPELTQLLKDLSDSLGGIIPKQSAQAFTLGLRGEASDVDLLREFDLLLSNGSATLPIYRQSDGLAQLAVFVFALRSLIADPKAILLIDEPEISLHPQAQRALAAACLSLPNQSVIATHSSNILDRADFRKVVRLHQSSSGTVAARSAALTEPEARRLARFVNPLTAEACFARKVIFVEGYSDRVVLLQLAARLKRNLDAEGITVVSLDGGSALGTYLRLLGPQGLNLVALGLCDEDKEKRWISELSGAGIPVTDRASLEAAGFFVCVKDLEQEFVRALGLADAQTVIAAEGETNTFTNFQKQPAYAGKPLEEQLRSFLHKDATQWAIPLVDGLNLSSIPGPLDELFKRL